MARYKNTIDTPLTDRQNRFVHEYLLDPSSASKAAKRAGYSIQGCRNAASELMKDPRIQLAIEEGQEEVSESTGITKERILLELAKIGFANLGDIITVDPITKETSIDIQRLSRDVTASLSELSVTKGSKGATVKVKLADKHSALIAMGKHLGMFNDRLEISGNIGLQKLIEDSFKYDIIEGEVIEPVPQLVNDEA